jgi:hypothetical protein
MPTNVIRESRQATQSSPSGEATRAMLSDRLER